MNPESQVRSTKNGVPGASLAIVLTWLACAPSSGLAQMPTRPEVLSELEAAERAFERAPDDADARFEVARQLLRSGEFWRARDVVRQAADRQDAALDAVDLAAELAYLTGAYDEAASLYERLIAASEGDMSRQVMAKVQLLFTYYQQDRFTAGGAIEFPQGVQLPNADLMRAFEEDPYRQEWEGDDRVAEIEFLDIDPLPVVEAQVNGIPVNLIIDTGGDLLILDDEIAAAMGVETLASAMGTFGGGLQSEIGFGAIDRLRLDEVTLHGVPITTLPTKRFTMGRNTIGGILGTAVLRQFLSTLDYENERLVLVERTPENRRRLRDRFGSEGTEIPFVLAATHLMMARGSLNEAEGLTFFVDSGLASEAVLAAPIQTLELLGIPEPETSVDDDSVGGGGGQFASGSFALKRVGLGPLEQTNVTGSYGSRPPESHWHGGKFIVDALLSHSFLKRYSSWTLDFDSMTYVFGPRQEGG